MTVQSTRATSSPSPNSQLWDQNNKFTMLAILYISYRIALANSPPITDCDETYNYWEPLHFLQYRTGMQTWEYAKPYELRTYAYLLPFSLLSKLYTTVLAFLGDDVAVDKRKIFYALRATIGGMTSLSEIYYIRGIQRVFGAYIALTTMICLAISPGMFHASSALLPSTAVMQYVMLSVGHTLQYYNDEDGAGSGGNYEKVSVFMGLMATICTGWPFAAALFLPLGLRAVYLAYSTRSDSHNPVMNVLRVLLRTALHALAIQGVVTAMDYYHYQSFTLPTLNILKYNAMQGDDSLYGIEPLSYYVRNMLLNFNGMSLMACLAVPLMGVQWIWCTIGGRNTKHLNASLYSLSPMIIWLILVCPRPHKEERFLFPIYPFVALACSLALNEVITISTKLLIAKKNDSGVKLSSFARNAGVWKWLMTCCFFLPVIIMSTSRSMALHMYYTAPLELYSDLYDYIRDTRMRRTTGSKSTTVCLAGEWYRFPSSYMLPDGVSLEYLTSSFKGQLPQPFLPTLGSAAEPHQLLQPFNDVNREEPSRYIAGGIASCDFVIELLSDSADNRGEADGLRHMNAHKGGGSWKEVMSSPFLDAERTGTLGRILYVPSWFLKRIHKKVVYAKYALFQRTGEERR